MPQDVDGRPHLLLIDDDAGIADLLQADLEDAGHRVTSAFSVRKGLLLARELRPDLILTDLGLPDGDGLEIVETLRAAGPTPVIVLTARDDVARKVALLKAGADDDVVKPFTLPGALEVQLQQRLALLQGQEVRLSPKEVDLLSLLMEHPGRVFRQADLSKARWAGRLLGQSNMVDVHFANLRATFRERGVFGLLRTVRGVGSALKP